MRIVAAKPLGEMPVYDLAVDHSHHSFVHESGVVLHNCAYIIANKPIHEFIPLTTISGVKVTQYTANSVEAVGGVKYDFLGLNSLKDISDAIALVQKRSGVDIPEKLFIPGRGNVPRCRLLPFKGQLYDVWDLPEMQEVFRDISESKTETVFQFNTNAAMQWLEKFNYEKPNGNKAIDSIEAMAAFTALDRPGPLDAYVGADPERGIKGHNMMEEFANRARGLPPTDPVPALDELLPETYGIMVYQEQLQKVYAYLTGCSGTEAETFRRNVAKKKVEKVEAAYGPFIEKASEKIGREMAEQVWSQLKTFGQYGFNKSHAVCYSIIAYACAFLKHYYPLEWWTAVLRNADKNEIAEKFWTFTSQWIDMPDINLSGDNWEIHNDRIRAPLGFLSGVGPGAQEELNAGRPYANVLDLAQKIEATKEARSTINPETGKKKKGTSALNAGVVCSLIVSGAMDSLFPDDTTPLEKLDMYFDALRIAQGKKKKQAVPEKYASLDELSRYQFRKQILPIYSDSLIEPFSRHFPALVSKRTVEDRYGTRDFFLYLRDGDYPIRMVEGDELAYLYNSPVEEELTVAVAGYVQGTREFTYKGNHRAVEFTLDLNGTYHQFVKWPEKKTGKVNLPPDFSSGCLVIAQLTRWKPGKPFNVDSVHVVRYPPGTDVPEESK